MGNNLGERIVAGVFHAHPIEDTLPHKLCITPAADLLDQVAQQPADKIDVLANELLILQQSGRTEQAITLADQAFALIESQQMQLESARLGPYWSGKMQAIYMSHADYLLGQNDNIRWRERAFAGRVIGCVWPTPR